MKNYANVVFVLAAVLILASCGGGGGGNANTPGGGDQQTLPNITGSWDITVIWNDPGVVGDGVDVYTWDISKIGDKYTVVNPYDPDSYTSVITFDGLYFTLVRTWEDGDVETLTGTFSADGTKMLNGVYVGYGVFTGIKH